LHQDFTSWCRGRAVGAAPPRFAPLVATDPTARDVPVARSHAVPLCGKMPPLERTESDKA